MGEDETVRRFVSPSPLSPRLIGIVAIARAGRAMSPTRTSAVNAAMHRRSEVLRERERESLIWNAGRSDIFCVRADDRS